MRLGAGGEGLALLGQDGEGEVDERQDGERVAEKLQQQLLGESRGVPNLPGGS